MRKRNIVISVLGVMGLLILILDGRTAAEGIRSGLNICMQTLIPSLFPFFVLSGVVTGSLIGQPVPLLNRLGKLCHMPLGSESLLVAGFLGGYPVGAATVYRAYKEGQLTASEANRMAIFCNNAGPSFLFGMIGPMFPNKLYVWCLWIVQILSALLTAFLLEGTHAPTCKISTNTFSLSESLNKAVRNMAAVCGWVVLFRMVLEFLDRWLFHSFTPIAQVILTGILELSNGCLRLEYISNTEIRFIVSSAMLSFGGICILMQTLAVFPGLHLKQYLAGKALQLTLGCILSIAALMLLSNQYMMLLIWITVIIILSAGILALRSRNNKLAVAIPE